MTLFSLKKNDLFTFKGSTLMYCCVGLKYVPKQKGSTRLMLLFEYKNCNTGTSYYSSDNSKEVILVKRKIQFFI